MTAQRLREIISITAVIWWIIVVILISIDVSKAYGQDVKTYIPERAYQYLPTVKSSSKRLMPYLSTPWYFAGLIEHESCISLKHSRCWSPTSELKTSREHGVGLGQITRAWRSDGTLRFDSLEEMRRRYPEELGEWNWSNAKERYDLQISAIVLMIRQNYDYLNKVDISYNRLAMSDAAYNGGLGNVNKARQACGLSANCDPDIWFDQVEKYMPQNRSALYGQRSAYDIVTHHVKDVLTVRMLKYQPYFEASISQKDYCTV